MYSQLFMHYFRKRYCALSFPATFKLSFYFILFIVAVNYAAHAQAFHKRLDNAAADSALEYAINNLEQGNLAIAERFMILADSMAGVGGSKADQAKTHLCLAKLYGQTDQIPLSDAYLSKALPLFAHPQNANDSNNLADYYLVRSNNKSIEPYLRDAIAYLDSGLNIAVNLKNSTMLADMHNRLSVLYYETRQYDKAVAESDVAMRSMHHPEKPDSAYQFYLKGGAFIQLKKYDSGMKYSNAAMKLYKELGSLQDQYMVLTNIAGCYLDQYDITKDKRYIALVDKLDLPSAIRFLKDKDELRNLYGSICCSYSNHLINKKQYAEALKYARIAYDLNKGQHVNFGKIEAMKLIIRATMERAGENAVIADEYLDAVATNFSENNAYIISDLEKKYKLKEKEEELVKAQNIALTAQINADRNRKYFVYALLSVGILVMGYILYNRRKEYIQNQEISDLKARALRLQMNPHFIFNCLAAIQHFIVNKDTKQSNKYLLGFATLMRQTLDMSTTDTIALEDEIDYLKNYLSLQQLRFENRFTYNIQSDADIDAYDTEIFPMIIQPFVENAVEHAFPDPDKHGSIDISFHKEAGKLVCLVEDNGIGRDEANRRKLQDRPAHISHGVDLTQKRMSLLGKRMKADIAISISDKKNADGIAAGTVVRVEFPLKA